ncbi:MAG: hypothetical protein ABRQ37_00110 [Candidatus Eremiobacterota bacterium]
MVYNIIIPGFFPVWELSIFPSPKNGIKTKPPWEPKTDEISATKAPHP